MLCFHVIRIFLFNQNSCHHSAIFCKLLRHKHVRTGKNTKTNKNTIISLFISSLFYCFASIIFFLFLSLLSFPHFSATFMISLNFQFYYFILLSLCWFYQRNSIKINLFIEEVLWLTPVLNHRDFFSAWFFIFVISYPLHCVLAQLNSPGIPQQYHRF